MSIERTLERAIQDAKSGRLAAAIAAVRTVLRLQPRNADAMQILGLFLSQGGQQDQAVAQLARAVELAPRVAGYRNNLGNALVSAGRHSEAVDQYRMAIELDPAYHRAHLGLALALLPLRDSDAAIAACRAGLALRPDWPEMAMCAAAAYEAGDRMDEAVEFLEAQVARNPGHEPLRSRYLFSLNYITRDADRVALAHRAHGSAVPRAAARRAMRAADADRPLQFGILSGDLRTHSVAYFAEAILATKPARDRITCFATGISVPDDPIAQRLRSMADDWVDCAMMDDAALDRTIREAGIDVLVELSGHSSGGRLSALDAKPAPVIATAIGYPNTTGHPAVDVRIVDSITDPPGRESLCTERLVRIDPCFLCYRPPEGAPAPQMPDPGAHVRFGSFNLTSKVSDATLALWSGAMAAVPEAHLTVKSLSMGDASARARLLERMSRAGIPAERVETVPYTATVDDHLALYRKVHVALDTTPYNGTTTTCEALWMGVPVVAVAGDRHAARVGMSILAAAGLPELVAADAECFVRIAAGLARDRARLGELRSGLRDRLRASVLLDQSGYGARIFGALRQEWVRWCAGPATP
ncbi:MAG: tetratricopeptide repeat protein [Phycisphaerales bacterium]|nr:tetratricopeptide repeat protein [Phycisphaerales bacterium]